MGPCQDQKPFCLNAPLCHNQFMPWENKREILTVGDHAVVR
jgi:hypothetical protein